MFAGRPLEWLGGIYQVQIHLTEKQNSSVILTSCGRRVKERERQRRGKLGVQGEHEGGRWERRGAGNGLRPSGVGLGRSAASCLGGEGHSVHGCHLSGATGEVQSTKGVM